uniref:Protein lap4 n=3 Tax=Lygus hesperus TaxID=30085 RepID=A0A146L2K0_LYGHE
MTHWSKGLVDLYNAALQLLYDTSLHAADKLKRGDYEIRTHNIYVTLIRDQNGLGFSIAGGKGCPPFKENSDAIYISRITEGGAAEKNGKLQVGDRLISINGVNLDGARHDQAVTMLTGHVERFVRIVAEREMAVPRVGSPQPLQSPGAGKSPRITAGGQRPHQALHGEPERSATPTSAPSPPRPAPRRLASQTSTASESEPTMENRDEIKLGEPRTKPMTSEEFQALIPAHFLTGGSADRNEKSVSSGKPEATTVTLTIKAPNPGLANGIEFPEAPTNLGRVTETITKSTLTETVVTRVTDNKLAESVIIEEVTLVRDGSLGFSIIGGTDHSCIPFGSNQPGIFISHIVPGGIAETSGKLRMGDRILKVNGEDLTKVPHQEAVMALLKPTKNNEITLTVQHDPLPDGFQELTIVRQDGEKLGMHIKGGLRGHKGNPLDKTDEGVFISKINSGGAAKRDSRLKVGMRLLEVNGASVLGASHQEAVTALRNAGQRINLVVCKGYDKTEVDRLQAEGKLTKENKSASQSVSSLDREAEDSDNIRREQEMKQELVSWEKEEHEKKEKEKEIKEQGMEVEEFNKDKSTPEKVMDVVRAAEMLALSGGAVTTAANDVVAKPKSPGGPKSGDSLKTTTIVMSKHTLAPQSDKAPPSSTTDTTTNGAEAKTPAPKASVSDKLKFFEKAMEEHHQPSPKPERVFTFLSQDEVEKLKQEEEKKIASMTKSDLSAWSQVDEDLDVEDLTPEIETEPCTNKTPKPVDGLISMGSIRTAKAERRMKERLIQEGLLSDDDDKDLSPAEQRALKAEKKAAWRQARLKSLEQDALQAQMVIKKMSEMIDGKTMEEEGDPSVINNNTAVPDHENNVIDVETTREKIISLELSTPDPADLAAESCGGEAAEDDDDGGDDEPTTPTAEEPSGTLSSRRKKKRRSKKSKH